MSTSMSAALKTPPTNIPPAPPIIASPAPPTRPPGITDDDDDDDDAIVSERTAGERTSIYCVQMSLDLFVVLLSAR